MHRYAVVCLCLVALAASASAQCPVVNGVELPCSSQEPRHQAVPPTVLSIMPALPDPLFTAEQVARDTAPEFLALLNNPTWDNAVRAAQVDLYRVYRAMVAVHLKEAARKGIIKEVEQQTGLSLQANFMPFLAAFARMWGLPITDLTGIPAPTEDLSASEEATARLLAETLVRGPKP